VYVPPARSSRTASRWLAAPGGEKGAGGTYTVGAGSAGASAAAAAARHDVTPAGAGSEPTSAAGTSRDMGAHGERVASGNRPAANCAGGVVALGVEAADPPQPTRPSQVAAAAAARTRRSNTSSAPIACMLPRLPACLSTLSWSRPSCPPVVRPSSGVWRRGGGWCGAAAGGSEPRFTNKTQTNKSAEA
jgi:hypothetical protein